MDKYGGSGIGIRLVISDRSITGDSFTSFRLHTALDEMPEGEFAATLSKRNLARVLDYAVTLCNQ